MYMYIYLVKNPVNFVPQNSATQCDSRLILGVIGLTTSVPLNLSNCVHWPGSE